LERERKIGTRRDIEREGEIREKERESERERESARESERESERERNVEMLLNFENCFRTLQVGFLKNHMILHY
jgi:hypothetical protein